ncbi:MAG: hypothetical protein GY948_04835 [Alphaproteobacteria bacterium]|nr:hypothetical protein [Alphaproteobacteria bacterium]
MNDAQAQPEKVFAGLFLGVLIVLTLVHLYTGFEWASRVTRLMVLGLPVLAIGLLRLREMYLLSLSAILAILVWLSPGPAVDTLLLGLERGAYLASFMVLMALLREGALFSPSVKIVGTYLTLQPPKRRFLALFTGGHIFSVLINLGSVSLLTPFIQRGVRGDQPLDAPLSELQQIREQRQLSAILRGFCWFLVWAPTAVTQAILPGLLPGIDASRLIPLGLAMATVMLAVGWLEDALIWRKTARRLHAAGQVQTSSGNPFPKASFHNLTLVFSALFGFTIAAAMLGGVTAVTGIMLAAPFIVIAWVVAQNPTDDSGWAVQRLRQIGFAGMPGMLRELVFMSCAGFIGTTAAFLVPAGDLSSLVESWQMPAWLFLWALSVAVLIAGHLGLSPITMAVFLGTVISQMPSAPADVTLCALAIAAGTAITSLGAPFASAVLMLSRASGYPATTLTWRWNGLNTALSTLTLAMIYFVYLKIGV